MVGISWIWIDGSVWKVVDIGWNLDMIRICEWGWMEIGGSPKTEARTLKR